MTHARYTMTPHVGSKVENELMWLMTNLKKNEKLTVSATLQEAVHFTYESLIHENDRVDIDMIENL